MRFLSKRALAASAILLGTLAVLDADAARPEAIEGGDGSLITPQFTPRGVGNATVTVVLKLTGASVAEHQGDAGRRLSPAEKDSIKAQLRSQQAALLATIAGLGGTVVATYQASYNGIKVRIAQDKLSQLAGLPGVLAVRPLQLMSPDNVRSVPLIGAPSVWNNPAFRGRGVKIGIIDTGIDYTHANFGGPGTPAAYAAAHASETLPANPSLFGPAAPRVKGGIDLVGDSYNADPASPRYQPIPYPDTNPLDCNGHGSHVAGTAAGSGVTAAGTTYRGAYNATTVSSNNWNVGPGVAPSADLYAIRVFGCEGSTDVVVDAIEWAVDNDMDVINMSLGSSFGTKTDPSAEAATNAAKAGVVVVTSAGNSGSNPYIVGSPSSGEGAISVAANDPTPGWPGASLVLSKTGATVLAINANGASFTNGTAYPIAVLRNAYPAGSVSLGCSQSDYAAYPGYPASLIGKMIVTLRGTCSRVARAIFAQQNRAAAALMINNTSGYPPFEGSITGSAETGPYTVTIPFLGVSGVTAPGTDGRKIRDNDGAQATASNAQAPNPNYLGFADFSSAGPRLGDSGLKPEITAPGVSIVSTDVGSGNGGVAFSGTSMASPHVAGVAALTREAHPTWNVEDIKAAIVNTGLPAGVARYKTSRGGSGFVQPVKSVATQVVARASGEKFASSLNYGFHELSGNFSQTRTISLQNNGASSVKFNVAQANAAGSSHTIAFNKTSLTIGGHSSATVNVTLNVPAATAGAANGSGLSFQEVAGVVEFTPASASDNGGVTLRMPYYLVARARSNVSTRIGTLVGVNPSTTATVTNSNGAIAGDADFYAWGLQDPQFTGQQGNNQGDNVDPESPAWDVRAVGVQSFPFDATRQLLVFAVNTYNRWSSPSVNEFDILVDVDGDGRDDYVIVGADQGLVETGSFNGRMGSYVFSLRSGGASRAFLATAPTDSSVALLPVLSSQLCRTGEPCLSAANPRIRYHAVSYDLFSNNFNVVNGVAKYNAWSSAISQGGFATVAPGGSDTSNAISVNSAEWAKTPAMGLMVVTLDNKNGASQAQLIPVSP